MPTILVAILRVAAQVLAGVGVADLLDKFVKDKVPTYYPEPISPGWKAPKILWLIAAFVIAGLALRLVNKKLKLKILR